MSVELKLRLKCLAIEARGGGELRLRDEAPSPEAKDWQVRFAGKGGDASVYVNVDLATAQGFVIGLEYVVTVTEP